MVSNTCRNLSIFYPLAQWSLLHHLSLSFPSSLIHNFTKITTNPHKGPSFLITDTHNSTSTHLLNTDIDDLVSSPYISSFPHPHPKPPSLLLYPLSLPTSNLHLQSFCFTKPLFWGNAYQRRNPTILIHLFFG